jgi:hypothetical protein
MSQKHEVTFSGSTLLNKEPATVESALLIADDIWREHFGLPTMSDNDRLRAEKMVKKSRKGRR